MPAQGLESGPSGGTSLNNQMRREMLVNKLSGHRCHHLAKMDGYITPRTMGVRDGQNQTMPLVVSRDIPKTQVIRAVIDFQRHGGYGQANGQRFALGTATEYEPITFFF